MLSVFCSPSRYIQGKDATAALGREMTGLGLRGPALLVAGRSAISLLSPTWERTFREAGIAHVVHPFGGECSRAEIERAQQAARQAQAQVIVGAGARVTTCIRAGRRARRGSGHAGTPPPGSGAGHGGRR